MIDTMKDLKGVASCEEICDMLEKTEGLLQRVSLTDLEDSR